MLCLLWCSESNGDDLMNIGTNPQATMSHGNHLVVNSAVDIHHSDIHCLNEKRREIQLIWDTASPWETFKENISISVERARHLKLGEVVVGTIVFSSVIWGATAINNIVDSNLPPYWNTATKMALGCAVGVINSSINSPKDRKFS